MVITVSTQQEKDELIKESLYIHDFCVKIRGGKGKTVSFKSIDSDKAGILMHIYTNPDMIVVKADEKRDWWVFFKNIVLFT